MQVSFHAAQSRALLCYDRAVLWRGRLSALTHVMANQDDEVRVVDGVMDVVAV